jgi:flagellar basal-body rod modification protein FlgD
VQLATFSGVEQQVQTNQLLENLTTQMGVMGMAQLAGWVGMEARSASPAYFDGDPITLAPNPVLGADQAVLVITDESGQEVVRRMIEVSSDQITWDGTADSGETVPEGLYSFSLESYENGELLETTTVETYSRITEAQGTASGTVLVLEGGVTIGTSDVTALKEPV